MQESAVGSCDSGIVLGFDDYSPDTWESNFDLFDAYHAKATFFVTLESPSQFCLNAQSRGHEIAYHTIHHPHLPKSTREEFFEETVSRISSFKSAGIELTTFAYPFGDYENWMNEELLNYFKVVRGYKNLQIYSKEYYLRGFIDSISIDNIKYGTDREFTDDIERMLQSIKFEPNSVIPLTSHSISSDKWGITRERLEILLKICQDMNLRVYTYKELE